MVRAAAGERARQVGRRDDGLGEARESTSIMSCYRGTTTAMFAQKSAQLCLRDANGGSLARATSVPRHLGTVGTQTVRPRYREGLAAPPRAPRARSVETVRTLPLSLPIQRGRRLRRLRADAFA